MKWLVVCVLALFNLVTIQAADPQAKDPPKKKDSGLPDLVGSLKETPGCLGVETARTGSGKQVIFAWFEDKKAALKWYHSDVHQQAMKLLGGKYEKEDHKPLAGVPDDSGPLMLVASITLEGTTTKENPLPFKQIAIEVYRPLPGGLSIGGSFAPEKLKVPVAKPVKK